MNAFSQKKNEFTSPAMNGSLSAIRNTSRHARYFRINRDQWIVIHYVYCKIHVKVPRVIFVCWQHCHWFWNCQWNLSCQIPPDPYRLCQLSGPSRKTSRPQGLAWRFRTLTQPNVHLELGSSHQTARVRINELRFRMSLAVLFLRDTFVDSQHGFGISKKHLSRENICFLTSGILQ